MSATLDKEQVEKVSNRLNSLRIIKETVEDMGATCNINWQTETVSINGPLPDLAYAAAIEAALKRINAKEEYDMGEREENYFVDAETTEDSGTVH